MVKKRPSNTAMKPKPKSPTAQQVTNRVPKPTEAPRTPAPTPSPEPTKPTPKPRGKIPSIKPTATKIPSIKPTVAPTVAPSATPPSYPYGTGPRPSYPTYGALPRGAAPKILPAVTPPSAPAAPVAGAAANASRTARTGAAIARGASKVWQYGRAPIPLSKVGAGLKTFGIGAARVVTSPLAIVAGEAALIHGIFKREALKINQEADKLTEDLNADTERRVAFMRRVRDIQIERKLPKAEAERAAYAEVGSEPTARDVTARAEASFLQQKSRTELDFRTAEGAADVAAAGVDAGVAPANPADPANPAFSQPAIKEDSTKWTRETLTKLGLIVPGGANAPQFSVSGKGGKPDPSIPQIKTRKLFMVDDKSKDIHPVDVNLNAPGIPEWVKTRLLKEDYIIRDKDRRGTMFRDADGRLVDMSGKGKEAFSSYKASRERNFADRMNELSLATGGKGVGPDFNPESVWGISDEVAQITMQGLGLTKRAQEQKGFSPNEINDIEGLMTGIATRMADTQKYSADERAIMARTLYALPGNRDITYANGVAKLASKQAQALVAEKKVQAADVTGTRRTFIDSRDPGSVYMTFGDPSADAFQGMIDRKEVPNVKGTLMTPNGTPGRVQGARDWAFATPVGRQAEYDATIKARDDDARDRDPAYQHDLGEGN